MPDVNFIDTNIWVYAHLRAPNEPKHPLALVFVKQLKNGVVSPQVIAEYYNVMLRNGKEDAWIQANIAAILSYTRLQPLDDAVVQRALWLRNRYGYSYWDCQILAAALAAGSTTLYSEDMQAGHKLDEGCVEPVFALMPNFLQASIKVRPCPKPCPTSPDPFC